jgi:hypothetical protein
MHACMYIMHACMCIMHACASCTQAYIHPGMHACMHACMRVHHACRHACASCMQACIHPGMHAHACTRMDACAHARMHAIHPPPTYIHIHGCRPRAHASIHIDPHASRRTTCMCAWMHAYDAHARLCACMDRHGRMPPTHACVRMAACLHMHAWAWMDACPHMHGHAFACMHMHA